MDILLVEPFFTGSHRQWAEGYAAHSSHSVEILALPGRHWKWRMVGGPVEVARKLKDRKQLPDLLLLTDMLDVSALLGLLPSHWRQVPVALYFHENQITYPWSPRDPDLAQKRDRHYGYINFRSALAADHLFFNSAYHREAFLGALPEFLRVFPDMQNTGLIEALWEKSDVLHLGLDLRELDTIGRVKREKVETPLILWNHRWEYDKYPESFFLALFALADRGLDFELAVLGDAYREHPPIFNQAKERLAERIVQWGYAESREDYVAWLWRADILPVSSRQDFFGASAVEAMYCATYALLPNRLAFPEHVSERMKPDFVYEEGELEDRLAQLLVMPEKVHTGGEACRRLVSRYDWSNLAPRYDTAFSKLANG
jgi:glycosyltransferase involved in cell wall biosynthesis